MLQTAHETQSKQRGADRNNRIKFHGRRRNLIAFIGFKVKVKRRSHAQAGNIPAGTSSEAALESN